MKYATQQIGILKSIRLDSIEQKTSYHEAGHAVAAIFLGGRVHRVSIEPDNDNDGPDRYGETITVWPRMNTAKVLALEIRVALAGPVAEMVFGAEKVAIQSVPEWRADWLQALQLAAKIQNVSNQQVTVASIIEDGQQWVTELFQDNNIWAAVGAIADELLTDYTLEEEQVDEIVGFWTRR